MRRALVIALLMSQALTACGLGFGAGKPEAAPGAIVGDPIAVTSLDAPAAGGGTAAATDSPQTPAPDAPVPDVAATQATPVAGAGDGAQATSADPASAEVAPQAPPAPPKSKTQISCERGGGHYAQAGKSGAKTCIKPTRDGGKQCRRQTDCDGMCLARSNSCAPVAPLFGCNEILQADGRRVTLCID